MDIIKELEQGAQALTTTKYLAVAGITLTLYDYLLMLADEIRYMWKGRKISLFYLYILNRIALTGLQIWEIYSTSSPRLSDAGCIAAYRAVLLLILFFLTTSDIFIILRVYALTFGNKIIAVYFGALALARSVVTIASFLPHATPMHLPPIPLDIFNLCAVVAPLQFRSVPIVISTVFDISAFLIITWSAYRGMRVFKLSAVLRTIVTEGTIYFLAMLGMQIFTQACFVLNKGLSRQYSYLAYSIINPVLTMRFALSLKRSAESGNTVRSAQFSSAKFAGSSSSGAQVSTVSEDVEMDLVYSQRGRYPQCRDR